MVLERMRLAVHQTRFQKEHRTRRMQTFPMLPSGIECLGAARCQRDRESLGEARRFGACALGKAM